MSFLLVIVLFLIGYLSYRRMLESSSKIPVIGSRNFINGTICATRIAWSASTIGVTEVLARFLHGLSHLFSQGITSMWIGNTYYVVIMKPEFAEQILTSRFHQRAVFNSLLDPVMGQGLLTSNDGDQWRYHRKLLTPAFHFTILKQFSVIMQQNANLMIHSLKQKMLHEGDGITIDVHPLFMETSFDIITETALGQEWTKDPQVRSRYMESVLKFGEILLDRVFSPLLYWDTLFFLTPKGREVAKLAEYGREISQRVVDVCKQQIIQEQESQADTSDVDSMEKKKPFLHLLIREQMDHPEKLSVNDIHDEVVTFISAGYETTGNAMTWCTYMLGLYPEAQERVYDEISDLLHSNGDPERQLRFDEIRGKLPFTDAVILETLRLFPGVSFLSRVSDQEIRLNDEYVIPKGTEIVINVTALHRDSNHWHHPERFMPERFMDQKKRHAFSFLPFGAGSRNCIGQKFSLQELKIVIVSLVRAFKFQSLDQLDQIVTTVAPILQPVSPIRMKLEWRSKADH